MDETITQKTLPRVDEIVPSGAQDVPTGDGGVTVEPAVKEFFEVANEQLGKNFTSNDAAIQSLKDTFSAVGKWGKFKPLIEQLEQSRGGEDAVLKILMDTQTTEQPVVPQPVSVPQEQQKSVDTTSFVSKEQYEEDMWFASHSQVAPYKTILRGMKKETNKSFDELLEIPEFKSLLEAKTSSATNDASRSVIHSNASVQEMPADYAKDLNTLSATKGKNFDWVSFMKKHKGIELN